MTGAEGLAQAQADGALDQEGGAELRAFGDEDPAQGLGRYGCLHGTRYGAGDRGVEVGEVSLGLFGAAALGQVRDQGNEFGVGVERLKFGLEQVLGNHEAREIFTGFERCLLLDQLVELLVGRVGQLVQALRAQAGAFAWVLCGGHVGFLGLNAAL
ncbi:hypothetical protein D3C80_1297120 [compost metagenome]